MLLNIERRNIETSNLTDVSEATIEASPQVFSFFSDITYSSKVLAILRELVANAIDAHTMAGYTGPVQVYLPSNEDPTLRVVDHGISMSHVFMVGDPETKTPSRFMAYTNASTKTGSNEQIGGFGIGSKSPFSYTDQFMIRCIYDGVASIYSVFKNERNVPCIGTLDQAPTDEGNGVEVIVPVKPEDFCNFKMTAETALAYFEPRPLVDGVEVAPPEYSSQGRGWAVRKQAGRIGVIMGGVRYEVPESTVPHDLARYGIDVTLPIGTCAVALSRETLSMDNDTRDAIKQALDATMEEIVESFGTMFDDYPTIWQAKIALANEVQGNWARSGIVTRHAKYRGVRLEVNSIFEGQCWKITKRSNRAQQIPNPQFEDRTHFNPREIYAVIVDDAEKRGLSRIRHRFNGAFYQGKKILVVKDQEDLAQLGNPPREIVHYTGQMDLPPPAERTTYAPSTKFYNWSDTEIQTLDGRVCKVEMTGFQKPSGLIIGTFVSDSEVVCVNKKDWGAVKHLPTLQELYEQRKAAYLAEHGEFLAEFTAVRYNTVLRPLFDWLTQWRSKLGELTPAQKARPFGKIVTLFDRYQPPAFKVIQGLVEPKLPARLVPRELVDRFTTEQWQVRYLMSQHDDVALKLMKELM